MRKLVKSVGAIWDRQFHVTFTGDALVIFVATLVLTPILWLIAGHLGLLLRD